MRSFLPALLLSALLLPGCSEDSNNPVTPPADDERGTAVGPNHAFAANGGLAWSGVTNEAVGASSPTAAAGTGLLAMHVPDGAVRVLDPVPPKLITLAQDGSHAYYVADLPPAQGDSVVLRRVALSGGGTPERLAAEPEGSFLSYAVSADNNWIAYAGSGDDPFTAAPMWLLDVSTGTRAMVALGSPVVLSPGGEYLIYRPDPGSFGLRLWVRATGNSSIYDPGVPVGAGPPSFRWDAQTLKVAYISPPRRLYVARPEIGGIPVLVYQSPDSFPAAPPVWGPDGQRLALFASRPAANGNYVNYPLHVADLAATTGTLVASGTQEPGGVAISPSGLQTVQLYGEQLYVADVHGLGLVAAAPSRRPARAVKR